MNKLATTQLFVTGVTVNENFLIISGNIDPQQVLIIENLLEDARSNYIWNPEIPEMTSISIGLVCVAKYMRSAYYRAKILSMKAKDIGVVRVCFIDFGNYADIPIKYIRLLKEDDPLLNWPEQANQYYLARHMKENRPWNEEILSAFQTLICYKQYPAVQYFHQSDCLGYLGFVSLDYKGIDLSTYLASIDIGTTVPLQKQIKLVSDKQTIRLARWITENCSFNPNSDYAAYLTYFTRVPKESLMSIQNLVGLNNNCQPHKAIEALKQNNSLTKSINLNKEILTYKKGPIPQVYSKHEAIVTYVEGPESFVVRLIKNEGQYHNMMYKINNRQHIHVTEPIFVGKPCLGWLSEINVLARAVIVNFSLCQCELYFVDHGCTKTLPHSDMYEIPQEFLSPNVFGLTFCLSGIGELQENQFVYEIFKREVDLKVVHLKVVPYEGKPLIHYAKLYINSKNIFWRLKETCDYMNIEFKPLEWVASTRHLVKVSYVYSHNEFYIQYVENLDDLKDVLENVNVYCEANTSPGRLPVGTACCAKFPDNGKWYRAIIMSTEGCKVVVQNVDYGYEKKIDVNDLRFITPALAELPAQAMKCALKVSQP